MKLLIPYIDWEHELRDVDGQSQVEAVKYLLRNRLTLSQHEVVVDSDVDKDWLTDSIAYLMNTIGPGERVTLYAYSSQLYSVINDFMKGGKLYEELPIALDLSPATPEQWADVAFEALRGNPVVKRFADSSAQLKTEEEYQAWRSDWIAWLLTQSPSLYEDVTKARIRSNHFETACLFIHQARVLGISTLSQLRSKAPLFSVQEWNTLLTQYVADMMNLFAAAPPLPSTMTVYRGIKSSSAPKGVYLYKGFVSTSMSKKVAQEYLDPSTQCCLLTLTLPKGSHVLPVFALTRYRAELEILLPPTDMS